MGELKGVYYKRKFLVPIMSSYPDCRYRKKSSVPDVRQLAELFEKWGYDFRLIFLDRHPDNIFVSSLVRHQYDSQMLPLCKLYLYSIKALNYQLARLDPLFFAGAVSIERTRGQNIKSSKKFLKPNLNLTDKSIELLFTNFQQQLTYECIESVNENQSQLLTCRNEFYNKYFDYRKLYEKFFL